ncbi:MAG: MFS transporter [Alphaproteobacteria bacterium]|nr:MFS transporter [Alphaproteobacteria bacterium]
MASSAGFAPIIRVFRHRNYALYMGGMSPNLVTIWMQRLAVGWLAWELTNSTTWLGVIAAADLLPMLFLAPIAGAITDRHVPLTLQKITQVFAVLHAAGLAVFTLGGLMDIWLLLAFTLFHGIAHTLASTARHAIVPATVPRAEFSTAIAVDSALFNGSRFVGPAAAGLIIPFAGVGGAFAVNTVGCVIFLASLYFMDLAPPVRESRGRRSVFADVGESFAYVRSHAGIGPLFFILTVVSILFRPVQDMLPGFAGAVFGSDAVGLAWLTSAMGVGAMLSAIWIALRGRVGGLTPAVVAGFLTLAMVTLGLVATPVLWVGVIFAALSGFALNTMSTGGQALVQYAVDDAHRGRVMGLYTLIYRGTPAIGALALGAVAELAGLRATFAAAALIALAIWVPTLPRRRSMRAALEHEHV